MKPWRGALSGLALIALSGCSSSGEAADTTPFIDTNGTDPNPEVSEPQPADWYLDPSGDVSPESTSLQLIVTEIECASAISPVGRIGASVEYLEAAIRVSIIVNTVGGSANCPSNPPTPFTLQLTEPLGDRTIEGERFPGGVATDCELAVLGGDASCYGSVPAPGAVAVRVADNGEDLLIAEQAEGAWHLVARLDVQQACVDDLAEFEVPEWLPPDLGCVEADDGSGVRWGTPVVPGAVGGRVTAIQSRLVDLGYLPRVSVSGTYDVRLRQAVLAWQHDIGMVAELALGESQLSELGLPYLPTLSDTGIGTNLFGDDAEAVEADLATWLGPPTTSLGGDWVCYAFTLCLLNYDDTGGDDRRFVRYELSLVENLGYDIDAEPTTWIWRTEPLATESGITTGSLWSGFYSSDSELMQKCAWYDMELEVENITVQVEIPYELYESLHLEYGDTVTYTTELGESATVRQLSAGEVSGYLDCD